MICWYAISCDPAVGIEERRRRSPWYTAKATPAAADMHAALRDALAQARINTHQRTYQRVPENHQQDDGQRGCAA
jgi:hypothetical protein